MQVLLVVNAQFMKNSRLYFHIYELDSAKMWLCDTKSGVVNITGIHRNSLIKLSERKLYKTFLITPLNITP
jgi:hypothetical protein